MSPHYNRNAAFSESTIAQSELGGGPDDGAMDDAAEALRQAEVEAVQPDVPSTASARLEDMSIDELRAMAAALDVPNRGAMTDQNQLIAAIRERL